MNLLQLRSMPSILALPTKQLKDELQVFLNGVYLKKKEIIGGLGIVLKNKHPGQSQRQSVLERNKKENKKLSRTKSKTICP